MKKRKSIGLCVGICLLLLGILDVVNVFAASKKMFDMAGVKYRQFVPKGQTIEVDL